MKSIRNTISVFLALVIILGMVITPISAATPPAYSDSYTIQTADEAYKDELGQDFRTWLQYDSRWRSKKLGNGSAAKTMGEEGCTVTAVTKLIVEAGIASPTTLNPGILVDYLTEKGGFDDEGALKWKYVQDFCQDTYGKMFYFQDSYSWFRGTSGSRSLTANSAMYADIITQLRKGYHFAAWVGTTSSEKYGSHWIAVDEWKTLEADDGNVYIMDSWSTDSDLRHDITLDSYLDSVYPAVKKTFYRLTAYKTPDNTDNYRAWSRYDERWIGKYLDTDKETIGDWGQALIALTKALIQAGVVTENTTPLEVLGMLQSKNLITAKDGVIQWTSLDGYDDGITAAQSSSVTLSTEAVLGDIRSGKHYIIRTAAGNADYAWVTIDEPMSEATGELYVLASNADIAANAGSVKLSDILGSKNPANVYTFTANTSPKYVQIQLPDISAPSYGKSAVAATGSSPDYLAATGLSVSEPASFSFTYELGDGSDTEVIPVTAEQYVPENTAVTVTADRAAGYSAGNWNYGSSAALATDSFTFTAASGNSLTYTPVPTAYDVNYTKVTDACGFTYGETETSVAYGDTVDFTVLPVNDTYTVTVFAKDSDDGDVAVTKADNSYSFTQPIGGATVTVTAEPAIHTVYLDAKNGNTDNPNWYIYTWTNNSDGAAYAVKWIKPAGTTPEGFYQFDGVLDNLIIVRGDPSKDFDTLTDKWEVKWNQSFNQLYGTDYTDSNNLFIISGLKGGNSVDMIEGSWSEMAGANTVYLYPKALDVRSKDASGNPYMDQFENYPEDYYTESVKEYYALTWNSSNENIKTWQTGTVDDDGIICFKGIKDKVRFFRIKPDSTPTEITSNNTNDDVWGYTDVFTVQSKSDDLYVLDGYYFADTESAKYNANKEYMKCNLENIADVVDFSEYCEKYAIDESSIDADDRYKYMTKSDARWKDVTMGTSTAADDKTGSWTLSQVLAKLAIQANPETFKGWDVTDFTVKAINSSGLHTWSDYTSLGMTSYNNSDSYPSNSIGSGSTVDLINYSTSSTRITATTIYDYLLEGKHVLIRTNEGEWVTVDEEKTLFENPDVYAKHPENNVIKIFVLRSTDNGHEVGDFISSSISGAFATGYQQVRVYEGGTTPGLTRDFDYRYWSINDGRWTDVYMNGSNNHYMKDRGATIAAIAKMLIQASVKTTSDTPLELINYLNNANKFTSDGALKWPDVNTYSDSFFQFDTTYVSNAEGEGSTIYLKFNEPITATDSSGNSITVSGYPRKVTNPYIAKDQYGVILEAIKQGYHMLLEVSNNNTENSQMWLCVDEKLSLENNEIYVMDSQKALGRNADLTLEEANYKYLFRIVGYKGATTPIPENQVVPQDEGDESDEVTIMSPSLRPDTTDSAYLSRTVVTRGDENAFEYNYIYGPNAKVRVTVTGVVKGNTYRLSIADTEEGAKEFTSYVDVTADTAGLLDTILELKDYSLDTVAPGNTGGTQTIYLAVKNVATKKNDTVESNVLTTSMTYKSNELVTGFASTEEKTLYIYQDADENELIYGASGFLTSDAATLAKFADYTQGSITRKYHITDSSSHLVGLSEISSVPGVYTVTLTSASSKVGDQTIATESSTVLIDPARSSYKIRVVTPASYVYKYLDRFGNETIYTEYLDDTLSEDEMNGYDGNGNYKGMPQYISTDEGETLGNKLISRAPKVESGFNKDLEWKAEEERLTLDKSNFAVMLNATETEKTYTVTFKYYDGVDDVSKTGAYNTPIALSGYELPTVNDKGEKFCYWTDNTGRVASVYPGFNMMISENATFIAHYGDAPANVDIDGDGNWEAYNDGVKNSYKIEGNNRKPVKTVYTDFSLRFIDGDRRVQDLLNQDGDSFGRVESYGIIVTYDMNEANAADAEEYTALLKNAASKVANLGLNNIYSKKNDSQFRFLNFKFTDADNITNRNRTDIGVTWDYDKYAGKKVVGYSYVVYYDANGNKQIAVSDGTLSVITWPASAAYGS